MSQSQPSVGARLSFDPVTAAPPVLSTTNDSPLPTVVIVIGMAGSGKTTLMQRMLAQCAEQKIPNYSINLDPGVSKLPYTPNIDIRDTVDYKAVQKQYGLGPNGAILTSLNLFATRFDQVLALASKRAPTLKYIFIDTPGQIEVFTWSASGVIISEALSCAFPTVVLYVIDTPRCQAPVSFMSNMMYACSIMYKSQLPFFIAFNKTDIVSDEYLRNWMSDYDKFLEALDTMDINESGGYMQSLTKSMSLVLDEFYRVIRVAGVSAVTGEGTNNVFEAIDEKRTEFYTDFVAGLKTRMARKRAQEEKRVAVQKARLARDREGEVVMDLGQRSKEDEEWAATEGFADEDSGPDEAENQDDEFESKLRDSREKSEFDEFMNRIRANQKQGGLNQVQEGDEDDDEKA